MKKILAGCILLCCVLLSGCGNPICWDITEKSIQIGDSNRNEYINLNNKEDGYCYVEINGVMYLPYGVQAGTITG